MKKIAIIIQNLNGGGAERTAANLSLYFSEKYEVHLIVFDGRIISYPHGGMLHDLKVYPSKSKVQKAINVIRRVTMLHISIALFLNLYEMLILVD